jgi:hypothetical protein
MPEFQIFCDARFNDSALQLLQEGVAPNRLVFPQRPGVSNLGVAAADPAMTESDIAFGQPDVKSVLDSNRLRWLQLTSAGYTRYDTPEFRAAAQARGLIVTNSSSVYADAWASMSSPSCWPRRDNCRPEFTPVAKSVRLNGNR